VAGGNARAGPKGLIRPTPPATARFLARADSVLIFGAPGAGKTHLAIALGRAVVEAGHAVLFTSATALLAALSKAETDGQLSHRLMFCTKPRLSIVDELGYLPFERRCGGGCGGGRACPNAARRCTSAADTTVERPLRSMSAIVFNAIVTLVAAYAFFGGLLFALPTL